jgi:MFS family permease
MWWTSSGEDIVLTPSQLPEAICVRLVQGIFGGAVGVVGSSFDRRSCHSSTQFRGSIRDITDDTNATRAYAILGFSWGFGGVVGPVSSFLPWS